MSPWSGTGGSSSLAPVRKLAKRADLVSAVSRFESGQGHSLYGSIPYSEEPSTNGLSDHVWTIGEVIELISKEVLLIALRWCILYIRDVT